MNASIQWPRTVSVNDAPITIRLMDANDAEAVLAFARALPPHDLLFLQRDIRNPRVVAAWIEQIERGLIRSLLAIGPEGVIGCAAIVRDELSWSPHVAEIRILIAPDARGGGLGRALAQDSLAFTQSLGVEKVIVRMTPDQQGAIAVFEDMGFRGEALLRDHVRDAEGQAHDIAILALDLTRQHARYTAFGVGEAY
jgi:RimJ/RimL family protein N-acetyltransferase